MNETKSQLINVEQEISAALSDGAHINEDQLNRLMDAYGRHNAKNDKIFDMVKCTIANAIDDELKGSGYEYIYEFFNNDTALLSVKLEENLKFECYISAGNMLKSTKALKGTIEAIQALKGQAGTFFVRPIHKLGRE